MLKIAFVSISNKFVLRELYSVVFQLPSTMSEGSCSIIACSLYFGYMFSAVFIAKIMSPVCHVFICSAYVVMKIHHAQYVWTHQELQE